jgi:hypothetical protein
MMGQSINNPLTVPVPESDEPQRVLQEKTAPARVESSTEGAEDARPRAWQAVEFSVHHGKTIFRCSVAPDITFHELASAFNSQMYSDHMRMFQEAAGPASLGFSMHVDQIHHHVVFLIEQQLVEQEKEQEEDHGWSEDEGEAGFRVFQKLVEQEKEQEEEHGWVEDEEEAGFRVAETSSAKPEDEEEAGFRVAESSSAKPQQQTPQLPAFIKRVIKRVFKRTKPVADASQHERHSTMTPLGTKVGVIKRTKPVSDAPQHERHSTMIPLDTKVGVIKRTKPVSDAPQHERHSTMIPLGTKVGQIDLQKAGRITLVRKRIPGSEGVCD